MDLPLKSIEQRALDATKLSAFPVNLMEIRRSVEALLTEVGRYGFFNEYTNHSFKHVYSMLDIVEWVANEDAAKELSPAECFLVTLCIYFHDLGLLITRDEFSRRKSSPYKTWAEDNLFGGPEGKDYFSRLEALSSEERDRILYQEYVRAHHGIRVRSWLEGTFSTDKGGNDKLVAEIQRLVGVLPIALRRDIAKLCESHNLDDIDDIDKYGLSHPYGNSQDEEADLQYVAVLLRTADLLEISNSRAPSVLFRVISPSDPVSQTEWHKQNAVTRVRRKTLADQEGRRDASLPSDTIEVYAHFSQAEGFFGLTSYLRYAESQLEKSFQAIEKSRKQHGSRHSFPWRKIDDSHVEAEGFIPKTFGFELDQEKILTLLTGHTLYNDSTVVIRELVQNAIDAVRLQWRQGDVKADGVVDIIWKSDKGELTVADNGTGMTQDVVERHLLKVGSSRYQDPQFKKDHPEFSPISRFGIGVLTAFMVADSVEIITVSPDEADARQISLRTVHGKYLIRLLPKSEPSVASLGSHGTMIRLRLRPSAKTVDVVSTLRRWIVFPGCSVRVKVDDGDAVVVGYEKPADAIGAYLKTFKGKRLVRSKTYRVVERRVGGLDFAYAIARDDFFKDWSLVGTIDPRTRNDLDDAPVGTCVEGIAVDFSTPGFTGQTVLAIANATGKEAPRTNVARSALEDTPQRSSTVSQIYNLFAQQVEEEVRRLADGEYSLSWAVGQAPFIAAPYTSPRAPQVDRNAFASSKATLPLFLLEDEQRVSASLNDLVARKELWLVEAPLVRSVESLIREAATDVTARSIIDVTHGKDWLPKGSVISNATSSTLALETLMSKFSIKEMRATESERRLDVRLGITDGDEPDWLSEEQVLFALRQADARAAYQFFDARDRNRGRAPSQPLFFPMSDIVTSGTEEFGAVSVLRGIYILPGSSLSQRIRELYENASFNALLAAAFYAEVYSSLLTRGGLSVEDKKSVLANILKHTDESTASAVDVADLTAAVEATEFRFFDPLAWRRREGEGIDVDF
ncbi:hypothetical protein GVN18_38970 [Pseudomonas sp. ODNR1LW]|nr:hypothetical protein [Pseudomonas sp. ODNR1LW]